VNRTVLHPNIRLFCLFAFALALHLSGTWILPLIDRDEPRFSEASREMLQRGDWILPTFNNMPRYDKPPLTYWCQMAFYKLFGENDLAARLHSALFTALTALAVFGFCSRLYNTRAGWCAALAFTVSLQVMVQAKAAVADMPMVFFVAVTVWAGWELLTRPTARWWWIFYVALALGFLAKGPVAWLPIAGILIYAWRKQIPRVNAFFKFQYGIPLLLILVGIWGIPAIVKTQGDFFKVGIGKHVVERSFSPMEGHGAGGALTYIATLPLYFLTVFPSFLPWSIFTKRIYLRLKAHFTDAERYLLINILVIFVVFSLVKTKLPHYTLPAFPLLACLVAPMLAELSAALFTRLVIAMTALNLALAFVLFPWAAAHYLLPIKSVANSLKLAPNTEFASVDYDEPSQIWYFRRQLTTWHYPYLEASDVIGFMNLPGPRLCVVPEDVAKALPAGNGWEQQTFHGKDLANGKTMTLTLLLKR
jgi:4-amino-4-deoxy-L-arabinose transferase-like glycosyltransferase